MTTKPAEADTTNNNNNVPDTAELEQLVAEVDRGGRSVGGIAGAVIFLGALGWTLFQLWYVSPLPFTFGFGIFNDTEARSVHLGIAMFLGYMAYPGRKKAPRDIMPWHDWVLALVAAFCGSYLYLFYNQLALRPGIPTTMDVVVAVIGLVLLLEVTRRALGAPMAVLGVIFLSYVMLGPWLPDALAHRGASLERLVSHMWLTTEGVYGVALGVSLSYIFVFVLLGSLLDRGGAGNYMMQVSFALLGHLRGGPAKVAVVSSGMNGIVSASSVANVVTTGIFTIPLMRKAGYGATRAGAIETASSVDSQLMPPVMGAAAFLMIEYVGIPYTDIIRHALLPAVLSYISLFYVVHLEALRLGLQPMTSDRAPKTPLQRVAGWGLGISGVIIVIGLIYWIGVGVQKLAGDAAIWILLAMLLVLYVWLLAMAARHPDLPENLATADVQQPEPWPTIRSGLFYLIPIGILVWCLTVEMLSPGLSAFWGVMAMVFQMLTQRPLMAFLRKQSLVPAVQRGIAETITGLQTGARNMVGIAIACGTAGLIVGSITLTGLGLRMTAFVELVSLGNVFVMLLFTAVVCLIMGLGMPTTANYILMATLMAPVVVELGAQNGMVIPLIAVHMFVFYYGIMADITPPVGLATFAASAISGADPIKTGIVGAGYAMRTAVLPFMFIFNPLLLLIDVDNAWELIMVVGGALIASLTFAAATLGWMRFKCTKLEIVVLLAITFVMFRPDWVINHIAPKYVERPASELTQVVNELPARGRFAAVIEGMNLEGDELSKTVGVGVPGLPEDSTLTGDAAAKQRLAMAGLTLMPFGDTVQIMNVSFGSAAMRAGWEQGWDVKALVVANPNRPSDFWAYIPAMALWLLIWYRQGIRMRREPAPIPVVAT